MKIHLRFAMHRDIEMIHEVQGLIQGLVIPAHILAYQVASTSVFVCSLPDHPYIIDPMTYMLQSSREAHLEDGDLRPSVRKWCDAMHPSLSAGITDGAPKQVFSTADLPDLNELCENCRGFQLESIQSGHADKRAAKYIARYADTASTLPRCIVSPYFKFASRNDPWYATTLSCWQITKNLGNERPACPLLHFDAAALAAGTIAGIVADFREAASAILWANDFNQMSARTEDIRAVYRLVQELTKAGVATESLYGGFMMMLMKYKGLDGVSHGPLYTEHKPSLMLPGAGSGGVPERYYIPRLHAFRSLSQTNLILAKHPELVCHCPICSIVMGGDPDNIILFDGKPDLLRKHFFHSRSREQKSLVELSIEQQFTALRTTYETYHASISHLPNPDAVLTGADMQGLEYMLRWIEGLS